MCELIARRRVAVVGVGVLVLLVPLVSSHVSAAPPDVVHLGDLNKDWPKAAQGVLDIVDDAKHSQVAVGDFHGPPAHATNFGPGIGHLLTEALERVRKRVVNRKAQLLVQGSYDFLADPTDPGRVIAKLTFEVRDPTGALIGHFIAEARNSADIAKLLGVTASLPPFGSKAERNEAVNRGASAPKVTIDGAWIKANAASDVAVQIRAKHQNDAGKAEAREARAVHGQAFVNIKRDEIYEVVVRNNSDREAAASLTVDGLDVFTFSDVKDIPTTDDPKYTHFIIAPGKSVTIAGWHLRDDALDNYAPFRVGQYGKGDSPSTRTSQGKTGVLTVALSFTWPAGKAQGTTAPGFGPSHIAKGQSLKRDVAPPHEFVTVRYAR